MYRGAGSMVVRGTSGPEMWSGEVGFAKLEPLYRLTSENIFLADSKTRTELDSTVVRGTYYSLRYR